MVKPQQLPVLIKIKEVLTNGDCSIANLQSKTGIKRSTLNYYLGILELGGFITKKRINKKVTGRPTIISLDKKKFEDRRKAIEKEKVEHLMNPLIQKILHSLKKGMIEEKKLQEVINDKERMYLLLPHLNFLIQEGFIVQMFKITPEGKEFLKKFSKKI